MHPTEPRVVAVLDWELSTLGNPLADFTYLLMQLGERRDRRHPGQEGARRSRPSRRWSTSTAG